MCISANVNFAAGIGIAAVGVATLSHVDQCRAVRGGPTLFRAPMVRRGIVWLGMNHEIRPEATADVAFLFILYAQGILPFLIYWQFSGSHIDVGRPNSKLRDLRPSF